MIQAAAILLVGIAALALAARLRRPPPRRPPARVESPALCGSCGRMLGPREACTCGGGRRG